MIMATTIEQELRKLKPQAIDSTQCKPSTSLYQQITTGTVHSRQKSLDNQDKQWFNLGNGQTFNDPIQAAQYLLKREYGESFLFNPGSHEPVFIPSEFISNQYCKDSTTAVLDYSNIEQTVKQTLDNLQKQSPDNWFTKELESFLQTQQPDAEIDQKQYERWIWKVKVIYLLTQEQKYENLGLPTTASPDFTQECRKLLNTNSSNKNILKNNGKMRKNVEKRITELPPQDPILSWFFGLNLADRGEKTERLFFEKLLTLKSDQILQDTVILSSVNFTTDLKLGKHQEFDFLIFSWLRRLIIGVEVKRTLTETKAFDQLKNYHLILEKQLGDQLGPGWTFFPVVYVDKDTTNFSNHHYINLDTDVKLWLSSVLNKQPVSKLRSPLGPPLEQLKKVLQLIVFTVHISRKHQPRPITTSYQVDYVSSATESLSNAHNIVFYSKQQLLVVSSINPCYNKLIFIAGFGTGKTFLLQEKAILLSKEEEYKGRILHVVCNGEGLLYHDRKLELERHGITVVTGESAIKTLCIPWIRKHFKAIFFDEWNQDMQEKVKVEWLNEFLVCWIAPNSSYQAKPKHVHSIKSHFQKFQVIQLTTNLRNTKEIVKKTKNIAETQLYEYAQGVSNTPSCFPNGRPPKHVSTFNEAILQARLINIKGILIITDRIDYLPEAIFQITKEKVIKFFHSSQDDFKEGNPCAFLRHGNILVASRNYVSGFEWPIVIYKIDKLVDLEYHECNISMRCTTQLYIVGKDYDLNETFPHGEICSLLQPLHYDHGFLKSFKLHTKQYINDHVSYYKQSKLRTKILPVLQISKQGICERSESDIFSPEDKLQCLYHFLQSVILEIAELENLNDGVTLITPEVMNEIKLSGRAEQFLNFNYLMGHINSRYLAV